MDNYAHSVCWIIVLTTVNSLKINLPRNWANRSGKGTDGYRHTHFQVKQVHVVPRYAWGLWGLVHPRLVFGCRASISAQSMRLLSLNPLRKKLWSFPLSILSLFHQGLPLPSRCKFWWLIHYSSLLIFVLRSGAPLVLIPSLGCLNNGR